MDPVTILNFVLCVVIVVLSFVVYNRKKTTLAVCIGVAFGLFGISHLATLLGLSDVLGTVLIVVRTVAYLTIVYALLKLWKAYSGRNSV